MKLRGLMTGTLDGIVNENQGEQGTIDAENQALNLFAKTPLGDIAGSLGLDPKLAAGLIKGEIGAVEMLGEKFGMNPFIIQGVLAVLKKDYKELLKNVGKLAELPGVLVDPEVAQMIVNLAWKQSDVNIRTAVKLATVLFAKINKEFVDLEVQFDIDSRLVEGLVGMARGQVDRLLAFVVETAHFPPLVAQMLQLILALVKNEGNYMEVMIVLMQELLGIPENVCQGLGALCDENYASKQNFDQSGYDHAVDAVCQMLGIEESIPVQIIVHLARDAQGAIQRLQGHIVEFFNQKFGWSISAEILSSLLAAVNGTQINIDRLAYKYQLGINQAYCMAQIFSDKSYTDPRIQMERRYEKIRQISQNDLQNSDIYDDIVASAEENVSPGLKALAESYQPQKDSMEWMSKYFKLKGGQLQGLISLIRGPGPRHRGVIREIAQEVLRRMQLDEEYIDYATDIVIWATSLDQNSIKEAQNNLSMQFKDLTFVGKRLLDPKDLPMGYLIKNLGFDKEDRLVKVRQQLS